MGFKLEDITSVRDAPMVDREGAKIGKIEDVLLDRHTGRPAWAAVKTGWFAHKHTLVPIMDAFLNFNAEVQVPFTKEQVKQAPNIDPGEELTPEVERAMWRHYGMSGMRNGAGSTRRRVSGCRTMPRTPPRRGPLTSWCGCAVSWSWPSSRRGATT